MNFAPILSDNWLKKNRNSFIWQCFIKTADQSRHLNAWIYAIACFLYKRLFFLELSKKKISLFLLKVLMNLWFWVWSGVFALIFCVPITFVQFYTLSTSVLVKFFLSSKSLIVFLSRKDHVQVSCQKMNFKVFIVFVSFVAMAIAVKTGNITIKLKNKKIYSERNKENNSTKELRISQNQARQAIYIQSITFDDD